MCGLTGFMEPNGRSGGGALERETAQMSALLTRMTNTIQHRGPDDEGLYVNAASGIALGFRRLAIIDLSPNGHQPMRSYSGRYTMVFNGEVYNHHALMQELQEAGKLPPMRGHSDTEIMLACIEAYGLESAVKRFVGMFAIALWDEKEHTLSLVRDRLGVKPLYYTVGPGPLLFGSELKTLRAYPNFERKVDRGALGLLLQYHYIPDQYCIYEHVVKLLPGSILTVRRKEGRLIQSLSRYWSIEQEALNGLANPFVGSDIEALDALDQTLQDAISLRMVADVPLGVFLSGGIDSSLVTAVMQSRSTRPIKTFSIGFREDAFNEAQHARAVADYLGTDHTELYVTSRDALAVVPKLPQLFDEPFADPSQIPTYLVAELARKSVTVALSGDGGDELFGGYSRYFQARKLWKVLSKIPAQFRHLGSIGLGQVPLAGWETGTKLLRPLLPPELKAGRPADRLLKLMELLPVRNEREAYANLVWQFKQPHAVALGTVRHPTALSVDAPWYSRLSFEHQMMAWDMLTYLPDDILVKVDRTSMGVSLEAREPLLDHRLVSLAWRMPLSLKMREKTGKWALRQVLYRYVPQYLVERPKQGFGVPIQDWLRGDLKDWADALLSEDRLKREGYLRPAPIRKMWDEHQSRRRDWHYYLWNVLMFQAWLEAGG